MSHGRVVGRVVRLMELSTPEIAELVGGVHHGPARRIDQVVFDIRELGRQAGELFVASFHRFDLDDTNVHCVRAVRSDRPYLTERAPVGGTAIVVERSADAMVALGTALRRRLDVTCVAITGSVGKTTTKDLTAAALGSSSITHAAPRSWNTEMSVAATIVATPADADAVVLELGARYCNQIGELTEMAQPSIGVLTRVAPAHLGTFGSIENIAATKTQIITRLPAGAVGVVPNDDELAAPHLVDVDADLVRFGTGGDVRAEAVDVDANLGLRIRVVSPWGRVTVVPSCRGAHNVGNVLAALAVAGIAGVDLDCAAAAIEHASLAGHRMLVHELGRFVVIDDTYNATPASVQAGLEALAAVPADHRVALLGPLTEGPEYLDAIHHDAARTAQRLGLELVGYRAPRYPAPVLADADAVLDVLRARPGRCAVLCKGGRAAGMDQLVQLLVEELANVRT